MSETQRSVGESDGAPTVIIRRAYTATVDELWDACTNPERIPRWFLPVTGELRLGGRYQLEGNASGMIEACDPPHGFRVSWEFGGSRSWLAVRVRAGADGEGWLELEQTMPDDSGMWEQFGPGAVGVGWDLGLIGLGLHLDGGEPDPARVAAWSASQERRRFIAETSDAWAQAAIAAGSDPATAQAAAAKTTAFYTGVPVD
jgi:uncharacterized protein YndB with AHSA1/START domain